MEFITKHCPKCHKELQIPMDLSSCICMYCGESFEVQADYQPQEASQDQLQEAKHNYSKALSAIPALLEKHDRLLPQFTKEKYQDSFLAYVEIGASILQPAEYYLEISGIEVDQVTNELSDALLNVIEQEMYRQSKGKVKSTQIDSYRFFMAVYTVPMILYLNYHLSHPLADALILKWKNTHPKYLFHKSEFAELRSGFDRKGLCFITTAVCEALNKEDDCEELMTFRKFRDEYMQETDQRKDLVKEYYKIAPVIVTYIDLNPNRLEYYETIWREYLLPCLKDLKANQWNTCEKRYRNMVYHLSGQIPYKIL